MSCQTCCKIFCSRRDKEENCSEKITYVEAGILEKVKVNKIRMDIEKDIKRCEKLTEPQNANWIGISNQIAIGHVIERIKELEEKSIDIVLENSISKGLLKEELERAEKENKPYGEYEIESRMYWINQGKISLAKKLLEEE